MSYLIEDIAHSLKAARESKRLSQRALREKVGLTQSHISKIENGVVDLQLSNLIEMSRALDLEVMLVPRKLVSAVQSLVRSTVPTPQEVKETNQAKNELAQMQSKLEKLQLVHPEVEEFTRSRNAIKDLLSMSAVSDELERIRALSKELRGFKGNKEIRSQIHRNAEELQKLRNRLAHASRSLSRVRKTVPAYSLNEDDDHG